MVKLTCAGVWPALWNPRRINNFVKAHVKSGNLRPGSYAHVAVVGKPRELCSHANELKVTHAPDALSDTQSLATMLEQACMGIVARTEA